MISEQIRNNSIVLKQITDIINDLKLQRSKLVLSYNVMIIVI